MICDKLKETVNFQNIIKTDNLHYKSKSRKVCEYYLPVVFLRDIHERDLSLKDADDDQSNFAAKIKVKKNNKKKQLKKVFF